MHSVVLFLNWTCNFKCAYCWEVQAQKHGEFMPGPYKKPDEWIEALNRLGIWILDISGGEPSLQPGFLDIVEKVNVRDLAITTNLSFDLLEFTRRTNPDKVFSMTCSYHPTQKMPEAEFFGKCLFLKAKGYNITINYVTYPEQMYLIPGLVKKCEELGLRLHIDPYAPTKYYPYKFSDEEKDFLRPYVGIDRNNFFSKKMDGPRLCSGGKVHLNIQPNGDAYRCIHDKTLNLPMVGNIFDPAFKPSTVDTPCHDWVNCSGCDRDKITMSPMPVEAA